MRSFIIFTLSIITGCTTLPPSTPHYPDDQSLVGQCSKAYALITTSIAKANVSDAEAHPIDGYNYLRSNRFLASLNDKLVDENSISAWLDKLILLDQQAKTIEIKNLPSASRRSLEINIANNLKDDWSIEKIINDCPSQLKKHDLSKSEYLNNIILNANVPAEYSFFKRSIGLYPLTSIPVYFGYQQWIKQNIFTFKNPEKTINSIDNPVVYTPDSLLTLSASDIAVIIKQSRDTVFGIPLFNQTQYEQLARHFAPNFLIDESNDTDKIGHPVWSSTDMPSLDTTRAVSFVRLEYTWFKESILPQLVYTIWFPERPKQSNWDILGGVLDGIMWRVTIANDGTPLIADSIHPCGCYHLFFPSNDIIKNTDSLKQGTLSEGIETPQILPEYSTADRLTLFIASKTHYLSSLSIEEKINDGWKKRSYELIVNNKTPDMSLRSMPLVSGDFKSLYDTEGIVRGTERAERWLLWPMGIKSPGAMRQWGKHATAFVGRRHFDDPFLLDQAFIRKSK